MNYKVEIIETLKKVVEVTASSEEMAVLIAKGRYHDDEIVLDHGDFDEVKFKLLQD